MKVAIAVAVGLVLASAARAQEPRQIEAGPNGGFYCLSDEEVSETFNGKHRNTVSGLGPTCRRIEPFTKINALSTKDTPPAVVGVARIASVGDVAFALYRASYKP